jgi:hypothetical protein
MASIPAVIVYCLFCRQLAVLRLGWNTLGPKGGRALAEGLKYSSTLQQLLLPWSGIGDAGASHIAKAMESNSSVRLLDLSGCQVRYVALVWANWFYVVVYAEVNVLLAGAAVLLVVRFIA